MANDFPNGFADTLADLYPTEADARRLARDVGLSTTLIDFDGPARNVMGEIIIQAKRQRRLGNLFEVLSANFPESITPGVVSSLLRHMSPDVTATPRFIEDHPFQYARYTDLTPAEKSNELYQYVRENTRRGVIQNVWLISLTTVVGISQIVNLGLIIWLISRLL